MNIAIEDDHAILGDSLKNLLDNNKEFKVAYFTNVLQN